MRKIIILFGLIALASCTGTTHTKKSQATTDNKQTQQTKLLNTPVDTFSYCIGVNIANSLGTLGIKDLNPDLVSKGMADMMIKDSALFTNEQAEKFLTGFLMAKRNKEAQANLKVGQDFLAANAKKDSVVSLPSGLQYKVIKPGSGDSPAATDEVTVNYKGMLIDGTVFDSSYDRNEPATFPLNKVIKGWTEGLQLMKPGAKYIFFLPAELAYGENSPQGSKIKPNSVLIFEVELLSVNKK